MHTSKPPIVRRLTRSLPRLAVLVLLGGCMWGGHKEETPEAIRLHANLMRFSQYYTASITATADEIAEKTDDRLVRELTIRWKIGSIPVMRSVIGHEDPRNGLVDAWMLCTRQRINFEEGALKTVFGDQQHLAVAQVKELEGRIQDIARTSVPPDLFEEALVEIEAFSRSDDFQGKFRSELLRASSRISEQSQPGLFHLLSIPIGGLNETAKAINRIAAVGEVFTQVVSEMPERTRWETQLFLLEEDRTGVLGSAVEDFGRLSSAIESMAQTAKGLPAEVRAELEGLMSASNTTLQRVQAIVTDTRAMLTELEAPLASAKATSAEMAQAGSFWTTAGAAVNAAMTTISNMEDDDSSAAAPATAQPDDSFKVTDLTAAGDSIQGAATELRGLLGDLESKQTEATVQATLDQTTRRLEQLVDAITLRASGLLVVLLVGGFLICRYARRP